MPTATKKTTGIRWIGEKRMAALVDKRARAVLNVSGATFAEKRFRGEYAHLDADACPGIIELALLAPSVIPENPIARKKR